MYMPVWAMYERPVQRQRVDAASAECRRLWMATCRLHCTTRSLSLALAVITNSSPSSLWLRSSRSPSVSGLVSLSLVSCLSVLCHQSCTFRPDSMASTQ